MAVCCSCCCKTVSSGFCCCCCKVVSKVFCCCCFSKAFCKAVCCCTVVREVVCFRRACCCICRAVTKLIRCCCSCMAEPDIFCCWPPLLHCAWACAASVRVNPTVNRPVRTQRPIVANMEVSSRGGGR